MTYLQQSQALALAIAELVKGGVKDSHCYRSLIDNLHAYRIGAKNKTDKWDTRLLKKFSHWTCNAIKQAGARVEKEHVVPVAEIVNILLAMPPNQIKAGRVNFSPATTVKQVNDVIDKFCLCCMVTDLEHGVLNATHQRSMPEEFWIPGSAYYLDVWARYKKQEIRLCPSVPKISGGSLINRCDCPTST